MGLKPEVFNRFHPAINLMMRAVASFAGTWISSFGVVALGLRVGNHEHQ